MSSAVIAPVAGLQRRHEIARLLGEKGRHVLAVCESTDSWLRWLRLIPDALTKNLSVPAETFVADGAEAMIDRFNAMLQSCDLSTARSAGGSPTLKRLIVVPDIRALAGTEGLLFTRLVSSFPGSGVRLLILAERSSLASCERVLDSLSRGLDIVELDPSEGLAAALRPKTPRDGARDALKGFGPGSSASRAEPQLPGDAAPDAESTVAAVSLPAVEKISTGRRFAAVDFSQELELTAAVTAHRPAWRRTLGWAAACLSLLLVSALVVVLLHRDRTPGGKPRKDEIARTLAAPSTGAGSSAAGKGR